MLVVDSIIAAEDEKQFRQTYIDISLAPVILWIAFSTRDLSVNMLPLILCLTHNVFECVCVATAANAIATGSMALPLSCCIALT